MKKYLYIPSHLKKLEIIDNFAKMIDEYDKRYSKGIVLPNPALVNLEYSIKEDPVKKFIYNYLPDLGEGQNKLEVVNYISHLLYCSKGTSNIFEILKIKMDLDMVTKFKNSQIILEIKNVISSDITNYKVELENALSRLLYFNRMDVRVKETNITLDNKFEYYIRGNIHCYSVLRETDTPHTLD